MEWSEAFGPKPERSKLEEVGTWEDHQAERLYRIPFLSYPRPEVTHILEIEREFEDSDIKKDYYPLSMDEAREWLEKRDAYTDEDDLEMALNGP